MKHKQKKLAKKLKDYFKEKDRIIGKQTEAGVVFVDKRYFLKLENELREMIKDETQTNQSN